MVFYRQSNRKKINTTKIILLNLRQKVLSICDYSNGFILVTGDITVTSDNNADIVLTNCASFSPHA